MNDTHGKWGEEDHCWICQMKSSVRVRGPALTAHLCLPDSLGWVQALPKRESSQPKADV